MNKNTYKTLVFLLVALTALACIIGVAVVAKGAISVLYRPTDLSRMPNAYLSPTSTSGGLSGGQWATSTANKWNSTQVTLIYNNGYMDFILWVPTTYNKIPQNTPYFVYFNISQMAIPQGAGSPFFVVFTSSPYSGFYFSTGYILWANATHVVARYVGSAYSRVFQDTMMSADTMGTFVNATRFNPTQRLVVVVYLNSGTSATSTTVYYIAVIQNGKVILKVNVNSQFTYMGPVTKYQLTVADVFASYQAPDVLLQTTTTTTTTTIPTLTVHALDANTGASVTGSVYLNGTLIGQTGKAITLTTANPNATQTIKITATGYYDYSFTARISGNLTAYVFLTPISQASEKVSVTFYTYDAITGNAIQGTISSGFTTYQAGKPYNITKGYYTFTASASGYKSLTFSVYISSNTVIPIYLYPQSYTATNSSGSVGYNPSTGTTTSLNQPSPDTYTGEYVGFHFINPSNQSVTVNVYAQVKTSIMGSVYNVLVDTVDIPARTDVYKSYNLRDVAGKAGVLAITVNPTEFLFTITANGNRIAQLTGDSAYQRYVDIYVARGEGFTAVWGSGLTGSTLNSFQWGDMLTQLMPLLIIAMIFGLIASFMPSKRR